MSITFLGAQLRNTTATSVPMPSVICIDWSDRGDQSVSVRLVIAQSRPTCGRTYLDEIQVGVVGPEEVEALRGARSTVQSDNSKPQRAYVLDSDAFDAARFGNQRRDQVEQCTRLNFRWLVVRTNFATPTGVRDAIGSLPSTGVERNLSSTKSLLGS
jgi:hypothetical protein